MTRTILAIATVLLLGLYAVSSTPSAQSPALMYLSGNSGPAPANAVSLGAFLPASTTTGRNVAGTLQVEKSSRWTVVSTPAVSNQASASLAAEAAVRHVADCVTFSGASTTAPAATKLTISLRDGATGAGTILKSWTVVALAATGQNVAPFTACGLNLVGTTNTAMTLEFSALLTNLFEDVTLTGYNVN